MKRFTAILSLVVLVSVTGFSVPNTFDNDFEKSNKEFNDYVFLLRNAWNYLDNNTVSTVKIYSNNTLVNTIAIPTGSTKDITFDKIFKKIYFGTQKITKIKMYSLKGTINNIDIVNNSLLTLNSSKLEKFQKNHLKYLNAHKLIQHNRGNVDMDQRIEEVDMDYQGIFAENIAASICNPISTERERIMVTLKKYYTYRTKTQHFNELMSLDYKFYTTRFLQDGDTVYSLTVMTNYKLTK